MKNRQLMYDLNSNSSNWCLFTSEYLDIMARRISIFANYDCWIYNIECLNYGTERGFKNEFMLTFFLPGCTRIPFNRILSTSISHSLQEYYNDVSCSNPLLLWKGMTSLMQVYSYCSFSLWFQNVMPLYSSTS